jgi:D-alanyl-D-alanine carboxypeptidase/D-alanyl-D-alanine-endopeptidase (penicillin-binding protein 4)
LGLWGAGLAATAPAARSLALGRRIEAILRRNDARRGFWGIVVARLPEGKILYERNADHLFLPASNMKLFTTAAAIEKLGPEFVFRTTVEAEGEPDANGRVGNLFLVGRGDPNIGGRVLPYSPKTPETQPADQVLGELAGQVVAKGVREVAGDIVADNRYYLDEPYGPDWSAQDLKWGYGAPVTALAFNDNALSLRILPARVAGETAVAQLEPLPDYYSFQNRLVTTAAGTNREIFVERLPETRKLVVWGEVPIDSPQEEEAVAIANPPLLMGELFRQALEGRGVSVRGRVRELELARVDAATMADPFGFGSSRWVLAEHKSLPLAEDIKVINKVSQNLHAEMLLRTMARELNQYGSAEVGLAILKGFADDLGVDPGETYFADGSGLSRQALVTPRAVVKLLVFMTRSPHFAVFYDSLPIAGRDGTLGDRFENTRLRGRVRAKTGTIEHVTALSGYMELPSGRHLAFSIMGNADPMKSQERVHTTDAIAEAIYEAWRGPAALPKRRP